MWGALPSRKSEQGANDSVTREVTEGRARARTPPRPAPSQAIGSAHSPTHVRSKTNPTRSITPRDATLTAIVEATTRSTPNGEAVPDHGARPLAREAAAPRRRDPAGSPARRRPGRSRTTMPTTSPRRPRARNRPSSPARAGRRSGRRDVGPTPAPSPPARARPRRCRITSGSPLRATRVRRCSRVTGSRRSRSVVRTGRLTRPSRRSSRPRSRPPATAGRRTPRRAGSAGRCASARGCAPTSRRCGRR